MTTSCAARRPPLHAGPSPTSTHGAPFRTQCNRHGHTRILENSVHTQRMPRALLFLLSNAAWSGEKVVDGNPQGPRRGSLCHAP